MPTGMRSRPALQANGDYPAEADDNTLSRRSRRLRSDGDDATELLMLPPRKRRKQQQSQPQQQQQQPADDTIHDVPNTPAATNDGPEELLIRRPRRSRGRPKKHQPAGNANHDVPNTPATNHSGTEEPSARRSRRSRGRPRKHRPEPEVLDEIFAATDSPPPEETPADETIWDVTRSPVNGTREAEPRPRPRGRPQKHRPQPPPEDAYDAPQSPPPPSDAAPNPEDEPAETEDEPAERQEDGDTHLYNEPTMMGEPADENENGDRDQEEGEDEDTEEQLPEDARHDLRELVADLGPPDPTGEVDNSPYPDDTFMFDPPADDYARAVWFIRSHSLKHMVELMSGVGWARRRVSHSLNHGNCRSGRTRQYWEHFARVRDFWEGMPRAPLFDGQAEYLRSDEDAAVARESVGKIDEFVRTTARRAAKRFKGDEESRPPLPFVRDLHEKVIPMLVHTLHGAFSRGNESDHSPWRGRFAKPSLQVMTRVLAWVERLYESMQQSLARTPRGQKGSQVRSREKLGGYVTGLKMELEEATAEVEAAPERRRLQEERARRQLEAEERDRLQEEERKRRQRELVDSRIAERLRTFAEALQPQPEPEPAAEPAAEAAPAETDWAEDEDRRLLQIIKKHPDVDVRVLAWEFERGVEDVRERVARLKQGARDYAASIGRPPPRFATA